MRTEIIDAAMDLLRRPGYPALKVESIAEQAAVSTATVYKHFPGGKEELRVKLIERALQIDKESLDPAFDSRKTPVDELIAIGWAYLQFGLKYPGYFQVVAQPEMFEFENEAELIAERVEGLVDRVAQVVERGRESTDLAEGERFPDKTLGTPRDIAEVLHGAWNGLIALSLRNDKLERKGTELVYLAGIATEIVRRGLVAPADPARPHDASAGRTPPAART